MTLNILIFDFSDFSSLFLGYLSDPMPVITCQGCQRQFMTDRGFSSHKWRCKQWLVAQKDALQALAMSLEQEAPSAALNVLSPVGHTGTASSGALPTFQDIPKDPMQQDSSIFDASGDLPLVTSTSSRKIYIH